MTNYSEEAAEILAELAEANVAYKFKKSEVSMRIRREFEPEIARLIAIEVGPWSRHRDSLALRAFRAGVPKKQIGLKGLLTSSMITVNKILDAASWGDSK